MMMRSLKLAVASHLLLWSFCRGAPKGTLTQSEFYAATWDVVNSPSTSVTKWGPIEDWDTSGVPSFLHAFTTERNEAGGYNICTASSCGNPKAAAFNGDISKWITSSVKSLIYTFTGAAAFNGDVSKWITSSVTDLSLTFLKAAKFVGYGLEKWDVDKVTAMTGTFNGATSITSCNKRKIADAWKGNAAFTATNPDRTVPTTVDWAADKCVPCEAGKTFSTSGNAPCATCAEASTCAAGVKTACTTTKNTACESSAVKTSGVNTATTSLVGVVAATAMATAAVCLP